MAWLNKMRLKSTDPEVRSKAVEKLDGSANSPDTDRIYASLTDESPQVRCAAIRALEKAHNRLSVESMIGALQDVSYQVRMSAVHALGRMRDVTSISPLVECLKDPEESVRMAAASALQDLGWMPLTEEELALFEIALGKPSTNAASAEDADPFLAEPMSGPTLRDSVENGTKQTSGNTENLRIFLAGLADTNPGIRISAIQALGKVPGEEIKAKILKLFRDRDPSVRIAAIQALASRDDLAPAFFLGLLDDPNPAIRLAALRFLGRVHHEQVADALLPALSDEDATVREATAAALGSIRNLCAVESLVVSLIDEARSVRQAAELALDQIDPNWLLSPATQTARVQIQAALSLCAPAAQAIVMQVLSRLPAQEMASSQ
jgi:HEAT repeat protein